MFMQRATVSTKETPAAADAMAWSPLQNRGAVLLQRKCACGGTHGPTGECEECRKKRLQRKIANPTSDIRNESVVPPIVHEVLRSPGQPLDPTTRAMLEPRFGHDFSRVRIHADERSASSANAVNAVAYTVGTDIVFANGAYDAQSTAGRKILAHELMHVVQQSRGDTSGTRGTTEINSRLENEAEQMAGRGDRTLEGQPLRSPVAVSGARPLQRLVRTTSVNCPPAAAGIANPHTGSADRRASTLLDTAITRIANAQAVRAADPANADVVAVGNALRTVFRFDPAVEDTWLAPAPNVRLPVVLRRLQAAKSYIDSVVFTVTCIAAGAADVIPGCAAGNCAAGTEAFSCHANATAIDLCPPFWALGTDQRGRIWMHETMHIMFGFIDDWGQPDVHNAHCYAQFVALLNGFNSPAGFRCH